MTNSVVLATGGYDHKIRFWEATSGICTRTIMFGESQVNCMQISLEKSLLAAGGNPLIQLFDVRGHDDKPVITYDGHTNNVISVGFHKDMKWVYSGSEDGTIRIWDSRTNKATRTYDCGCPVNTVTSHPNQMMLISGDQNGCIKVWDLEADKLRDEYIPLPDVAVRSISMASDGSMVASGSHNGSVYVYDIDKSYGFKKKLNFDAHNNAYLLKCVLSPDCKKLVTTSSDKTIKVWDTAAPPPMAPTSPMTPSVSGLSSDMTTGGGPPVPPSKKIDTKWTLEKTLAQHQKWVWDAVFSSDSQYLVSVSSDQTGKLWDMRNGNVVRTYSGHNLTVSCVALNDIAY